jgi:hypothetical protein
VVVPQGLTSNPAPEFCRKPNPDKDLERKSYSDQISDVDTRCKVLRKKGLGKNSIIIKCITLSCRIAGHADSQPKNAIIKHSNERKSMNPKDLRQIVTCGIL